MRHQQKDSTNIKNSRIEPPNKSLQNYYACLPQIASWGSDHASWILFLKYIRTNIYKEDILLSYEKKRTNFQLLPRTGSILLEQLLTTISHTFILSVARLQKKHQILKIQGPKKSEIFWDRKKKLKRKSSQIFHPINTKTRPSQNENNKSTNQFIDS